MSSVGIPAFTNFETVERAMLSPADSWRYVMLGGGVTSVRVEKLGGFGRGLVRVGVFIWCRQFFALTRMLSLCRIAPFLVRRLLRLRPKPSHQALGLGASWHESCPQHFPCR
jgi:hypothetical protein